MPKVTFALKRERHLELQPVGNIKDVAESRKMIRLLESAKSQNDHKTCVGLAEQLVEYFNEFEDHEMVIKYCDVMLSHVYDMSYGARMDEKAVRYALR
jgi:hypothetical protein